MSETTPPARPRRLAISAMVILMLLGGAFRWIAAERTFSLKLLGDEVYYVTVATNIAQGNGHRYDVYRLAWRPPGQAWLMSLFVDPEREFDQRFAEEAVRPMVRTQVVLGTLLIGAVGLLGWALFGSRVGLVAAGIAAFFPSFVANSHYLWSEPLFTLLVTLSLAGIVHNRGARSTWLAAGLGLVLGLAALVRELAIPLTGIAALWWLWTAAPEERRRAVGHGALLIAIAGLVVIPWTVRNYRVLERFVPVSTIGWFAAAEGNTFEVDDWRAPNGPLRQKFVQDYFEIQSETRRMDFARDTTLERIRAEQPTWIVKKALRNLPQLFGPDSILLYKLRTRSYGAVGPGSIRGLIVGSAAPYVALFVAAVLGLSFARGHRSLPLLILACLIAIHLLVNATPRFRLPWMPLGLVYAGYFLCSGRRLWHESSRAERIASLMVLGLFFTLCAPPFFEVARGMWSGVGAG